MYYTILAVLVLLLLAALIALDVARIAMRIYKSEYKRHKANSEALNNWLFAKIDGKAIEDYFIRKGYRRIAVYGANILCYRLLEELESSNCVHAAYIIDRRGKDLVAPITVCKMEELSLQEQVDVTVVCLVSICDNIKEELRKCTDCPVVSLEEVIYGI